MRLDKLECTATAVMTNSDNHVEAQVNPNVHGLPDMAQAGGRDPAKVGEAAAAARAYAEGRAS